MEAEVISIGDELTSGQRLDTNSQWISTRLGELGVRVLYHTTVADDLEANVLVFRQAAERADIIVATGGLGPTADDLTRDAIAAASGVDLVFDADALKHIESLFARRKRPMPERNRVQAMFPRGSRVIPNREGTAPGIDISVLRAGKSPARVIALPGVPVEMQEMWEHTVAPAISAMFSTPRVIRHKQIKCFGVGESDLEQMLPDLIRRGRDPQVGITVSGATITLRITASGENEAACFRAIEPTIKTIHDCLGNLVFGEDEDELQDAVVRLLAEQKRTLATAEWGSGGIIAHWLSEVTHGHDWFHGGLVCHCDDIPGAPLDLATGIEDALPKEGKQVIAAAKLCRQQFDTDYGVSVGRLPEGIAVQTDPPLLWYAVATPGDVVVKSSPYAGHPDILKTRGAKQALNLLRLILLREKD